MGAGLVHPVAGTVRARAGTAQSQLHGPGDDDRSLVFRGLGAPDRRGSDGERVAQQSDVPGSDRSLLAFPQMVRR
jgi:hypothetical protein